MDINDFRSLATVVCFFALVGVFWWAYTPKHKAWFKEAEQLPFDEDSDIAPHNANKELNR